MMKNIASYNNLALVRFKFKWVSLIFYILTQYDFLQDARHIWELGGGTLFTKLLETPLSPLKLPNIHVVIMVDLSKPEELWFTLETLIGM